MFQSSNNCYLVYEYCSGGTLDSLLRRKKLLSEEHSLRLLRQIVHGFSSLNSLNILHRDLKPSNILFHDGELKIADFGFCKSLETQEDMAATVLGSPIYMAPEILKREKYNIQADI